MGAASPTALLRHPAGWLATGFGAGLVPFAPGTVGSLVALAPYLALRAAPPWWIALTIAVVFVIGVRAADWTMRKLGTEDPGAVVIDEWVGQWLTLALMEQAIRVFAPALGAPALWLVLAVGFGAFRLCDIAKPWPVSWADRHLHGGFGAMLDDALAGVIGGVLGAAALYGLARIA
jgi:phosphatidylglycerophosphatase A